MPLNEKQNQFVSAAADYADRTNNLTDFLLRRAIYHRTKVILLITLYQVLYQSKINESLMLSRGRETTV